MWQSNQHFWQIKTLNINLLNVHVVTKLWIKKFNHEAITESATLLSVRQLGVRLRRTRHFFLSDGQDHHQYQSTTDNQAELVWLARWMSNGQPFQIYSN